MAAVASWALAAPIMYKILTNATSETIPKGGICHLGQLGETETANDPPMRTNPKLQTADTIEIHLKVFRFLMKTIIEAYKTGTLWEFFDWNGDYRAISRDAAMTFFFGGKEQAFLKRLLRGMCLALSVFSSLSLSISLFLLIRVYTKLSV